MLLKIGMWDITEWQLQQMSEDQNQITIEELQALCVSLQH